MTRTSFLSCASLLLVASYPAAAQTTTPPSASAAQPAPASSSPDNVSVEPRKGQSQQQQWSDRYECHGWAKTQSGYDPSRPGAAASPDATQKDAYYRALSACLDARGYTVKYAPAVPAAAAVGVAAAPAAYGAGLTPVAPELRYRPFTAHIDGGYTIAAGTTDQYLNDGPNVGLGFSWFPSAALPVGIRVDGSYSWFNARYALLNMNGNYTSGQDQIYGGDADLQLDLAHRSSRYKLYLFGGIGWYRERLELRQETLQLGSVCTPYFCAPAVFPVTTAYSRTTSPWERSWNAGLGWEIASGGGASFFIEARYLRIEPYSSNLQFVPIRLGVRF
jgi:hypothetical protein